MLGARETPVDSTVRLKSVAGLCSQTGHTSSAVADTPEDVLHVLVFRRYTDSGGPITLNTTFGFCDALAFLPYISSDRTRKAAVG
jgi:hypothetical protein